MRDLIDIWVGVQTWLFETLVSPVLFRFGLMEWFEPAFNAVEIFMLGIVQILVIALGMRFFEKRWPLEKTGNDDLVGVDRVYTVLNKLGIIPLAVFMVSYPITNEIELSGALLGLCAAPPRAARCRGCTTARSARSSSTSRSTTSPPIGCTAPSTDSPGGGRCTACTTASAR